MSFAGVVAAIAIRSEKEIAQALHEAGALSPGAAIPVIPQRRIARGSLRRMVRHGAVHEVGSGRYWLDTDGYDAFRSRRRGRTGLILGVVLAFAIAAIWFAQARAQTAGLRPDQQAFRALYEELVETNTTLSEGSCTLAAQRMAARLTAAGYADADVRVLFPADRPKDGALSATLHGSDSTASPLLLLAHIDVVEANRADWTRDPFTLIEEGGYFYARGASDDKAEASVWVDTLVRLKQEGFTPLRDIKLALTCGEETADTFNGVQWLLGEHPEVLSAGMALNEGAGGRLDAEGNRLFLAVQAGEKVYQDYQLLTTNPGGHSSRPSKDNAITHLSEALVRVGANDFPVELNPVTRAYFAAMADITPDRAVDFRALSASADPAAARRISDADPSWNSTMRTTCVATMVSAGHAPNALPQRASANVNCRILPGHSVEEVQAELVRVIGDPAVAVTLVGEADPSTPPPPLSDAVMGPIREVAASLWPDVPIVPTMSTGATDGRFTNEAGTPTYGLTGMFGDPDGGGVHGLNERIRVRSLYEGRDFLFEVVKRYAMQGG